MDDRFQFEATRTLAEAAAATGEQVAELVLGEVAEGLSELATAAGMATRSEELAKGLRQANAELAQEGIVQVAEGAADLGASEAMHTVAGSAEARADAE